MTGPDKSKPVPVKYWSFAGLMLTYWCNARCASCYVCSSPSGSTDMSVEARVAAELNRCRRSGQFPRLSDSDRSACAACPYVSLCLREGSNRH